MENMTRKEAADYLRISVRKLDYMAEQGIIRRCKLGDGKRARVLYRKKDLDKFVESQLSSSRADIEIEVARIVGH